MARLGVGIQSRGFKSAIPTKNKMIRTGTVQKWAVLIEGTFPDIKRSDMKRALKATWGHYVKHDAPLLIYTGTMQMLVDFMAVCKRYETFTYRIAPRKVHPFLLGKKVNKWFDKMIESITLEKKIPLSKKEMQEIDIDTAKRLIFIFTNDETGEGDGDLEKDFIRQLKDAHAII